MSLQTCYALNGTILPDYGSCSLQIGNNVCCAAGQTCLSNGLCGTDFGAFYSGGCTDETYASSVCPRFCTLGLAHFIVSCKGFAINTGGYCCSGDGSLDCCNDTGGLLPIAAGTSTAEAAFVIPVTLSTSVSDRSSLVESTSTALLSQSTTSSVGITGTPSSMSTVTHSSAKATSPSSQIPTPSSRPFPGHFDAGDKITIAISIAALVLVIAYFGYEYWRWSRDSDATEAAAGPSETDAGGSPNEDPGELEAQNTAIGAQNQQRNGQPSELEHPSHPQHDGADDESRPSSRDTFVTAVESNPPTHVPQSSLPSPETTLSVPKKTRAKGLKYGTTEPKNSRAKGPKYRITKGDIYSQAGRRRTYRGEPSGDYGTQGHADSPDAPEEEAPTNPAGENGASRGDTTPGNATPSIVITPPDSSEETPRALDANNLSLD